MGPLLTVVRGPPYAREVSGKSAKGCVSRLVALGFLSANKRANQAKTRETVETGTKPPGNRDETPDKNHETQPFFNMKKYTCILM